MNSEESDNGYGRILEGELDIIQNVFSKRNSQLRRVSFPESDTDLVTGYLEPTDPLRLAVNVNKEELLNAYQVSCQRHNTTPIDSVIKQIKEFNIDNERSDTLKLRNLMLTTYGCESLEEIFKRVQFDHIDLVDCGLNSETAFILFEMFEYYESTVHLNISSNSSLGVRGWQACARYLKKSNTLEKLETNNIKFNDTEVDCLVKSLAFNRYLQVLKLENCNLDASAIRSLVNALTINITLKELYLVDNNLGSSEAILLGNLLKNNKNLQILDLSNNQIRDLGLDVIVADSCIERGYGSLEVLILWNNYLTDDCSSAVVALLKQHPNLSILNVGCNDVLDSFVSDIKDSLKRSQSLLRLGLQATKLTCSSAEILADVLKINTVIERIDLRENRILVPGLRCLSKALDKNKIIIQIDLNSGLTSDITDDSYFQLMEDINEKCLRNKLREPRDLMDNEKSKVATLRTTPRKISLTCQTLRQEPFVISSVLLSEPKKVSGRLRSPDPSPVPSPVCSPVPMPMSAPIKSRFSVSRVYETENTTQSSRFTVTIVEPPKSVSPNSIPVIGFNCESTDSSHDGTPICTNNSSSNIKYDERDITSDNNCLNLCKSEHNCFHVCKEDCNLSPLTESSTLLQNNVTKASIVPSDEEKPLTSLERLLSLFQTPTNLFTKSSVQQRVNRNDVCTNKQLESFAIQCDSLNCFSYTRQNVSKNANMSDSSGSEADSQSLKENITETESSDQSALNISDLKLDGAGDAPIGAPLEAPGSDSEAEGPCSHGAGDLARSISDYTNNNKWLSGERLEPTGKQAVLLLDDVQVHSGHWKADGD